ncbi:hypothetical protein PR001_g5075 [Phytophthora rubi]|uniref:Uncharacterized protein n=1 Tax=Phytophthora rubi TaxID=129364 RepID=A0A6A3NVM3_9STRA|nr:hypothetical protein PR001_g5075 [Phytophthora rubi]
MKMAQRRTAQAKREREFRVDRRPRRADLDGFVRELGSRETRAMNKIK